MTILLLQLRDDALELGSRRGVFREDILNAADPIISSETRDVLDGFTFGVDREKVEAFIQQRALQKLLKADLYMAVAQFDGYTSSEVYALTQNTDDQGWASTIAFDYVSTSRLVADGIDLYNTRYHTTGHGSLRSTSMGDLLLVDGDFFVVGRGYDFVRVQTHDGFTSRKNTAWFKDE